MKQSPLRFELVLSLCLLVLAIGAAAGARAACSIVQVSPPQPVELDNGCIGQTDPIDWEFEWQPCPEATHYQLVVRAAGAEFPVVDVVLQGETSYHYRSFGYIIERHRLNWT
jgi:hypothetical protein